LIFISFLLCHVRGLRRVVFSLPSFSVALCWQLGARARPLFCRAYRI
jgi:hypothetical protein